MQKTARMSRHFRWGNSRAPARPKCLLQTATGAQQGICKFLFIQQQCQLKADHAEDGQDNAGENGDHTAEMEGLADVGFSTFLGILKVCR